MLINKKDTMKKQMEKEFLIKIIDFLIDEFKSSFFNNDRASLTVYIDDAFKKGFSVSWSLGGTINDYSGNVTKAFAEAESDLNQLDDFIMSKYPKISFMQYKMIDKAITKGIKRDTDYYGGQTQTAYKKIDFETLADIILKIKMEEVKEFANIDEYINYKINEVFPKKQEKNVEDSLGIPVKKSLGIADEKRIKIPKKQKELIKKKV